MRAMAGIISLGGPRDSDWLRMLGRRMMAPVSPGCEDGGELYISQDRRVMLICEKSHNGRQRHGAGLAVGEGAHSRALALLGEIYRVRAASCGTRQFATDAERLLALVSGQPENAGPALASVDGSFAVAWHDERTGQVVLARDQFGMKPLHWAPVADGILFATDVSCLFATGLIRPAVDPLDFLYRSYCRMECADNFSWYAGVRSLPSASLLLIQDGAWSVHQYWRPDPGEERVDPAETCAAFLNAVKIRKRDEERVAGVLSGGVDSSAVFCALTDLGQEVSPYVVTYEGQGRAQNKDLPYARLAAESRGQVLRRCEIGTDQMALLVEQVVARVHRPFVHGVELALYQAYRTMAADGMFVSFSGHASDGCWGDQDGSDFPILDIRGPVDMHSEFYLRNMIYRTERPLWHMMLDRITASLGIDEKEVTGRVWERIFDSYRNFPSLDPHKRARYHIMTKFGTYVNETIESCSAGFGITERTPFQDVELVGLAFRMPEFVKNHEGLTDMKPFLKSALAEVLPKEIVYRPKQGFPPPDDPVFLKQLRYLATDIGMPFGAKFHASEFDRLGVGELLYLCSAQIWLDSISHLPGSGR